MDGSARKRSAKRRKARRTELVSKLKHLHYLPSSFQDQVPDGNRDDSEKPVRGALPCTLTQSRLTLPNSTMFGDAVQSSICRRNIAESVKEDSQRPGDLQRIVEIGNGKMKKRLLTAYSGKPVKPQSRRAHQPEQGTREDFLPQPADTTQQSKKRPSSTTQQQHHHHRCSYHATNPQPQQCANSISTSTIPSNTHLRPASTVTAGAAPKGTFKSIDQSNGQVLATPVSNCSPATVLKSYLMVTPSPPASSCHSHQEKEVLDYPQLNRMTHALLDRLRQTHRRFSDTVTAMQTKRRNYFRPMLAQIKERRVQQRTSKKDETKREHVRGASSLPEEHVSQSMEWGINDPRLSSPAPARAVAVPRHKAQETERVEFAFNPTNMRHNGLSAEPVKDWHSDAFSLFQSPIQFFWRTGDHAQPSGKMGRRVVFEDQLRSRRETTFLDGHSGITKPIDSFVYRGHSTRAPCVDSTQANCSSDADITSFFANVSRNGLRTREAIDCHYPSQAVRLNSLPPLQQAFFYPGESVTSATQSIFDHHRDRSKMDQTPNQDFREPLIPKESATKSLPEWPTLEEANSAGDTPVLASSMQQRRNLLLSDELAEASFIQNKDNSPRLNPSMESTHISSDTLTPSKTHASNAEESTGDPFELAFVEESQAASMSMEDSVVFVEEVAPNLDISFEQPTTKDSKETLELVEDAAQEVSRLKLAMDNSSMGESFVILQPSLPTTDKSDEAQVVNDLNSTPDTSSIAVEVDGKQVDTDLPETVTRLQTPYGIPVYLVGTAHFSLASQEDVAKTIRLVQPNVVVVELCKSRVNMLHLDEETILREAKDLNIQKIRITIKQHGAVQGALYLLLLSMSAHITRQLGMAPGGEFRRAFQEAKKLPDCMVHLGDRPIQVTLQRALASLSIWQKIKLAWHLLSSNEPISKEEVEKCKQRDMLEEMLAEMTGEFPALSQVFVQERDIYLAHSLQLAADSLARLVHPENPAKPSVVAVVGIGHVAGVVERFGRVSQDEVLQIMKIPPTSLSSRLLTFTVKASLCGLALWGCYKVLPVPRISTAWSSLSERIGKI